jgi:hypothetical protein
MSTEEDEGAAPAQRGGGIWTRLALAVFLLPVVIVLFPTTVVLAPFMLPTVVAFVIDKLQGRPFTITVGLLNGAGTLPAVLVLWSQGHTLAAAQETLGSVLLWFIAYLCAAIGWVIYSVLPPLLRQYYGRITSSRVDKLRKEQDALIEEWGDDVTGAALHGGGKRGGKTPDQRIDAAAQDLPNQ